MKISEIITDKYKLRIPPTVYYDLLADVVEAEEEQQPTPKNDLGVDCISRQAVIDLMMQKWGENFSGDDAMQESIDAIRELPSVTPQADYKARLKADMVAILDKIRAEIEDLDIFYDNDYFSSNQDAMFKCSDVLQIIDKYKAEVEPQAETE